MVSSNTDDSGVMINTSVGPVRSRRIDSAVERQLLAAMVANSKFLRDIEPVVVQMRKNGISL